LVNQHKNIIVTRTFSKLYGFAGARLGYAIAHPELLKI
jgi:histidinol-phosphate aminotransferase